MLHLNFVMLLVNADVLYYVYKPVLKNKTLFFSQKKKNLLSIKGHFPIKSPHFPSGSTRLK